MNKAEFVASIADASGLTKAEVLAISNRLQSLENAMPIPKGIDPMKVRAQRAR